MEDHQKKTKIVSWFCWRSKAVVLLGDSLLIVTPIVGVYSCSMFYVLCLVLCLVQTQSRFIAMVSSLIARR